MRRVVSRVLVSLLALAGSLLLGLVATLLFGHVSGEEFAPDTFQRRDYSYFELPVLRIQVTPVRRRVHRPQLEQTLVDHQYIPVINPPNRWDLIASQRLGSRWREGDARILSLYLDAQSDENKSYWLHWTDQHPAMAKVFWPAIAKLANQDLYLFVPELFGWVAEQSDSAAFRHDFQRLLARKYDELAAIEAELNNFAAAKRFSSEAQSYRPDGNDDHQP